MLLILFMLVFVIACVTITSRAIYTQDYWFEAGYEMGRVDERLAIDTETLERWQQEHNIPDNFIVEE